MIDIQLAELFDRSGRLTSTKSLINHDDADKLKNDLLKRDDEIKNKLTLVSDENKTEIPDNEWK